jgi:hypothetical protein
MEDLPVWFKLCIYLVLGGTVLLVFAGVMGWMPG